MTIYFLLLAFILFCPVIVRNFTSDRVKIRKYTVILCCLAIYLLCALKSSNVGVDIPGYKYAFEQASHYGWFQTSYIYYERGYILLEKIFSFLGFSFEAYMAVVYALIFVPVGVFVYKYSSNVTISFIVYCCYQMLIFNISGIRQSIAMSLCLIAYMCLDKDKLKSIIGFVVIVLVATQIHRSAILFLLAFVARKIKLNGLFLGGTIVGFAGCFMFRSSIISIANQYTGKYQSASTMTLGGNFLLLLLIMIILLFLYYKYQNHIIAENEQLCSRYYCTEEFAEGTIKMIVFTVFAQLIFNGSSALRVANYFSLFMILAIPDIEMFLDAKSKKIYNVAIVVFMILLFYTQSLSINQFNCVPYSFFWQ